MKCFESTLHFVWKVSDSATEDHLSASANLPFLCLPLGRVLLAVQLQNGMKRKIADTENVEENQILARNTIE